jgi:hypothetical protein
MGPMNRGFLLGIAPARPRMPSPCGCSEASWSGGFAAAIVRCAKLASGHPGDLRGKLSLVRR